MPPSQWSLKIYDFYEWAENEREGEKKIFKF